MATLVGSLILRSKPDFTLMRSGRLTLPTKVVGFFLPMFKRLLLLDDCALTSAKMSSEMKVKMYMSTGDFIAGCS